MKKIAKKLMLGIVLASLTVVTPRVSILPHNTSMEVQAAKKKLTKAQAKKKVIKYLKKKKLWKKSYRLEYDHKSGNKYVFHYYEFVTDHTATINWYNVNIRTGKITAEF